MRNNSKHNKCPHCYHELTQLVTMCPTCQHKLSMHRTLGGTLFLYNGVERDYCFEHTLESMVGVCDQIALIDCYSVDGTYEVLQKWAERYPNVIKLEQRKWTPGPSGFWLRDLTNEARKMLTTDMHLLMGGDEVIHPKDYKLVRELANTGKVVQVRRYNFRASAWHITPMNRGGGGDWFRRIGPVDVPAECDGGDLQNRPGCIHGDKHDLAFYHYGQARTGVGFAKRSRDMLGAYYDGNIQVKLLDACEEKGIKMLCEYDSPVCVPWADMVPFTGDHPPSILPWLKEHGYDV